MRAIAIRSGLAGAFALAAGAGTAWAGDVPPGEPPRRDRDVDAWLAPYAEGVPVRADRAWLASARGDGGDAPADEPPKGPRTTPPVDVVGRPPPGPEAGASPSPWFGPTEAAPFGPYGAPEWISQRRFATTRAYVIPQGQVEFESWWKGKYPKHGDATHLFQEEISVGLPYRFQLDLYGNILEEPGEDTFYSGTQVELRYALADWDCLPGNPTLYGEWKFNTRGASDAWEAKLLLSDDVCGAPCWHWGVNFFYEKEIEGSEEIEMGFSAAIGRGIVDQRLSIGLEAQYERTTAKGSRDDPEVEFLLGPSVQIRFDDDTHLDVVPLFGLTRDSPDLEIFVIFGIALGGGSGSGAWGGPASASSR